MEAESTSTVNSRSQGKKFAFWQEIEATPITAKILWASRNGNREIVPEGTLKALADSDSTIAGLRDLLTDARPHLAGLALYAHATKNAGFIKDSDAILARVDAALSPASGEGAAQ